jgi:hypothetical protein
MKHISIIPLLILILLQGCSADETVVKPEKQPSEIISSTVEPTSSNCIDAGAVEWMKMQGALGINTRVLFSGYNDIMIDRIIKLINSGTGKRNATDEEIGAINSRARPVGLSIRLKNGVSMYVWPSYTIKTFENGWSASPRKDRFVLEIKDGDEENYNTIDSTNVAEYLSDGWKSDMPLVEEFKVDSDTAYKKDDKLIIRNGDSITVSGDGCTEKEVSISISLNGSGNECFLLGKAKSEYGKWEWKGVVCYAFTSLDGKDVSLTDGSYDIIIGIGSSQRSICGIVELSKGYYREFGTKGLSAGKFHGAVFVKDESLFVYNEDKENIKMLYSAPAFQSLIGLSPDKGKIAFLCSAAGEKAIGIYNIKKGSILYIPLENNYAYQTLDAWWQNDRVIVASGHVNPSANGFVCYEASTGKELSYCCGQLQATASDGRFMLFRLTPHWTDNPPPDNICNSQAVQTIYSVNDPKDIIDFVKLSADDKKLLFIETLNKSGKIRLNLADLNNNGTALSNLIKTDIDVKGGIFHEAFLADDFTEVILVTGNGEENDSVLTTKRLKIIDNEIKLIDSAKTSVKDDMVSEVIADTSRLETMTGIAGEFFKQPREMEEMGIESIDWF